MSMPRSLRARLTAALLAVVLLAACVQAVVINVDDFGARALSEELRATGARVVGYGEAADADVRLTDLDFDLAKAEVPARYGLRSLLQADLGIALMPCPGRHRSTSSLKSPRGRQNLA